MVDMENAIPQAGDVPPNDRQISVRLPLDTLDRCDALMARLEQHPQFGAFALSRNGVIKLLLTAGLEQLEAEYGVDPQPEVKASPAPAPSEEPPAQPRDDYEALAAFRGPDPLTSRPRGGRDD